MSEDFKEAVKGKAFTEAMTDLMNNVENGQVNWNLVQKALLKFTDDVLAEFDKAMESKKKQLQALISEFPKQEDFETRSSDHEIGVTEYDFDSEGFDEALKNWLNKLVELKP